MKLYLTVSQLSKWFGVILGWNSSVEMTYRGLETFISPLCHLSQCAKSHGSSANTALNLFGI